LNFSTYAITLAAASKRRPSAVIDTSSAVDCWVQANDRRRCSAVHSITGSSTPESHSGDSAR
jgi:hypothetical protein